MSILIYSLKMEFSYTCYITQPKIKISIVIIYQATINGLNMKKIILFSTVMLTTSMVYAEDGMFRGEIAPPVLNDNQVKVEHVQEAPVLQGRNDHDSEEFRLENNKEKKEKIDKDAIVGGIDIRGRSE